MAAMHKPILKRAQTGKQGSKSPLVISGNEQVSRVSTTPQVLRHSPLTVYLAPVSSASHQAVSAARQPVRSSPLVYEPKSVPLAYQQKPAAQSVAKISQPARQQASVLVTREVLAVKPVEAKQMVSSSNVAVPALITSSPVTEASPADSVPSRQATFNSRESEILTSANPNAQAPPALAKPPSSPHVAPLTSDASAVAYQQLSLPVGGGKTFEYIERYALTVDGARVEASVRKDGGGNHYHLSLPVIDPATALLLNEIRNELIALTTISMKELTDPTLFLNIKARFMNDASQLLKTKLPHLEKTTEQYLVGTLMQEMLGLGYMEFLVNDPNLEEIVIPSAKEPIRVYSKKYGWLRTNLRIQREEDIVNYANIIARRVGKQITVLNPLLDAHLISGDRINAVLYPINTKGNTITIRKFARDPYTIVDLISSKTCDLATASLLWIAVEYEMNVLISGGTASGKTSFLNAIMPFVPPNQRILSIEDTRELMLPEFLYWTPLVTRTPNPEGKGEVSMLDLLINSLRMRPDRIILGEMRRKEEAMVLFEAMHTGHAVYATVHADSAAETIARLVNPPISVPPNLLKAVHLDVVMFRDRKRGLRRVLHIAEFDAEKDQAKSNILYRWSPEEDRLIPHSENSRFFEVLSRNTGMSDNDIQKNMQEKQAIFSFLIQHHIRSLAEIGTVMTLYYRNKEVLLSAMRKNDPSLLFAH